jgi:hypothetical protein
MADNMSLAVEGRQRAPGKNVSALEVLGLLIFEGLADASIGLDFDNFFFLRVRLVFMGEDFAAGALSNTL